MPTVAEAYFSVPLEDLRTATVLGFDLYIRHIDREPVLYRSKDLEFTVQNRERLIEGGIRELLVPVDQRAEFEAYAAAGIAAAPPPPRRPDPEEESDEIQLASRVADADVPLAERCELLLDVTRRVVDDALADPGMPGMGARLDRVAETTVRLLRDAPEAYPKLVDGFQLDFQTDNHSTHTALYTIELARAAGIENPGELARIARAALLHDIGKGEIPEAILHKDGPLDDLEWAEVMTHPDRGVQLLEEAGIDDPMCLEVCGLHHERWDGRGYPRGLAGEDIPPVVRMVTITDTFDALTSEYPYRPALSGFQALWKMRHEMQGQFDPKLLELFIDVMLRRDSGADRGNARRARPGLPSRSG